ncbi:hypothetical protein QQF64_034600 [Cirrhinus molitorella]|uniref:Uncharacterized protein n=1 Tax=Cirrhinus molitorella TaxID=172907 RepID=A0ABR3L2M8_9TELE
MKGVKKSNLRELTSKQQAEGFLRSRNYVYESGKFDPEVYIRGPTKAIPTQDVRADAVGHWPQIDSVRQRCKFPKCTGHTSFKCAEGVMSGSQRSWGRSAGWGEVSLCVGGEMGRW